MSPHELNKNLKDVQNEKDKHNLPIDKVGIRNIKYPIIVLDRENKKQSTIADINMFVNLKNGLRGTHMSRFVEILNDFKQEVTLNKLDIILKEMLNRLEAEYAYIEVSFPYFLKKTAPVSGMTSYLHYDAHLIGKMNRSGCTDHMLKVEVPVTTLCPCSKEISAQNAHNQRSIVKLAVRYREFVWLEELIEIAESQASCEIYPLLKRIDEKYVTEKAYSNPRFVEDIVREIAAEMNDDDRITWYSVEAENYESIHSHNAYAAIEVDKTQQQEDK